MDQGNDIAIEAWNTVLFEKFSRFKHLVVAGLAGHSDEALARHPHPRGARVLDVGCGFGDSTLRIAGSVGPQGRAVGVDCAPNFVDAATPRCGTGGCGQRRVHSSPTCSGTTCAARTTTRSRASARCSSTCRARPCATSARPWCRAVS